jgi:hypothetical protein
VTAQLTDPVKVAETPGEAAVPGLIGDPGTLHGTGQGPAAVNAPGSRFIGAGFSLAERFACGSIADARWYLYSP